MREGQSGRINGGWWQEGNEQRTAPCSWINNTEEGSIAVGDWERVVNDAQGRRFRFDPGPIQTVVPTVAPDCGSAPTGEQASVPGQQADWIQPAWFGNPGAAGREDLAECVERVSDRFPGLTRGPKLVHNAHKHA